MKNKEYWISWAKAAGVRAVKTMAQVAGSMIVIGAFNEPSSSLKKQTKNVAGLASVFTSLAGLPEVEHDPYEKLW